VVVGLFGDGKRRYHPLSAVFYTGVDRAERHDELKRRKMHKLVGRLRSRERSSWSPLAIFVVALYAAMIVLFFRFF
jgi:hypothetical protein